jgi:hypothetical protein
MWIASSKFVTINCCVEPNLISFCKLQFTNSMLKIKVLGKVDYYVKLQLVKKVTKPTIVIKKPTRLNSIKLESSLVPPT